uniref:Ig-like domain-containing protein n=1 Tax=Leptobrachium leishanense TaxID=445787 RepID=A0A8C5QRW0_9ANUR
MACLGFLAAFLTLLHQTGALLKISTSSPQKAFAGSDVFLHCTYSGYGSTADPRFLVIMWFYQVKEIVRYHNNVQISHPRVSFDDQAARSGNASILLSDVKIEDVGIYSCVVIYSIERVESDIIMNVLVSPKIQIPDIIVHGDKEKTVVCSVSDFYPVDITITWLRDGVSLQNSSLGKIQRNINGSYSVDSTVTITPDHERKKQTFSCRVQHESLPVALQEDFQLVYKEKTKMIPVIVVVLLVLTVIGLGIWKLKSRKGGFTVNDIKGPPILIDGEEVILCCTGNQCAEDTRVIWLEKKAWGDPEIIERYGGDPEDTQHQLLNTSYDMDTKHMGSQCWSSDLRFTFHVANHKGVTFICRFISGNETQEKRFQCNEVYAKPKVAPRKPKYDGAGKILYSLIVYDFYPRDIQIHWSFVTGEGEQIISSEEQRVETQGLTFSVCSEARIPGEVFKDPKCKVRVVWEHASMGRPESREMSVRDADFPWHPVMEDIIIPKLEAGKEAALSCKISGYFPDSLSVQWIKKEKRNESEIKLPTGDYKVPDDKSNEETDKTFTQVTRLTFTPHLERDRGAKFICRVTHPTLEEPIEKRTGPLLTDLPSRPVMEDIIIPKLEAGKEAALSCKISGYFPDSLSVQWIKKEKGNESEIKLPDGDYKVSDITSHKQKDNTWTCEARLTFIPHLERDQGAEFICRVTHPTLEEPIEKRTGPLLTVLQTENS